MSKMLVHGEGDRFGEPFELLPWHREFLWRWYEVDPSSDDWWYIEALVGAERGAVKTEFFAALALLEFAGPDQFRRTTPIIHIAAAALKQAGELFGQAQIMAGGTKDAPVHAAPLHGLFEVYDQEILYRDGRPGRIERIAAEAGTAEGGKTSLFLGDELHEWTGRRERVYTVVSAALTKRTPPGRVCGMSTAAAGRGSIPARDTDPLLWRLYTRGLLSADDPTSRYLFDWRSASDRWDLDDPDQLRAALREAGRAADVAWSVEVRAREIETRKIPRHEAERYYLNRFVDISHDSWLTEIPGAWEDCADPNAVPADGTDVIVGVDMALHQDHVGVIVAGRLSDGRVGWYPRSWAPVDGRIDHLDVWSTIAGPIAQRWNVRGVAYDPRFFELLARLIEDHGIRAIETPQSPERLVTMDTTLYDLIVSGQLAHPNDPTLNGHAAAAVWREGERGRYLSKSKTGGRKMDLIRAGAMATYELLQPEAPKYEPAGVSTAANATGVYRDLNRLTL